MTPQPVLMEVSKVCTPLHNILKCFQEKEKKQYYNGRFSRRGRVQSYILKFLRPCPHAPLMPGLVSKFPDRQFCCCFSILPSQQRIAFPNKFGLIVSMTDG